MPARWWAFPEKSSCNEEKEAIKLYALWLYRVRLGRTNWRSLRSELASKSVFAYSMSFSMICPFLFAFRMQIFTLILNCLTSYQTSDAFIMHYMDSTPSCLSSSSSSFYSIIHRIERLCSPLRQSLLFIFSCPFIHSFILILLLIFSCTYIHMHSYTLSLPVPVHVHGHFLRIHHLASLDSKTTSSFIIFTSFSHFQAKMNGFCTEWKGREWLSTSGGLDSI